MGRQLLLPGGFVAFLLAACVDATSPAGNAMDPVRTKTTPAPELELAPGANRARPDRRPDGVELIDTGAPPRRSLRFRFRDAVETRYWIRAGVTLSDDDSTFVTEMGVPLTVTPVPGPKSDLSTFRLSLGPLEIERYSSEVPVVSEHDASRLGGQVELDARGAVRGATLTGSSSEALRAIWDSLLERDVLPAEEVGVGARWRHERHLEDGHVVRSDFELIGLESDTLTLRVWREQRAGGGSEPSLQTVGEWNVELSSWPPFGVDRVHATSLGTDGRQMQSSFAIQKSTNDE